MATAPVFRATSGLNNVLEPHRLQYGEDGGCPLAEGVNVVVDDGGGVKRRKGRLLLFEGPTHSLWAFGDYCFFVSDGKLYRHMTDGTNLLVNGSCGDSQMFYAEFGGRIYCTNGVFRAVLKDMTVASWIASVPAQYESDTRTLGMPTSFTRICTHAGRMYLVSGQFLWESEPGNPSCFDLGNGYVDFGETIVDLVAVRGGIYVSTTTRIFFLSGSSIADFKKLESYPAQMLAGTCAKIAGDDIGNGEMLQGLCAVWVSPNGVCFGSEDGRVVNVTSRRLVFSGAQYGALAVLPGQILFSLEV